MSRSARRAAVALLLAVAGCTLGPDPERRPRTAADQADDWVHADAARASAPAPDRWWRGFADPVTDELVLEAVRDNLQVDAATARVLAGDAALRAAYGARLPQVTASASVSRQRTSFVLPQVGRTAIHSTEVADAVQISWDPDLFGGLRRAEQAAWAELLALEAQRHQTIHQVVAAVVRSRVAIATLQRQLDLAEATAESWDSSLELVDRRYRFGLVQPLDVHLTRQSLATARAQVPELRAALAEARHALHVLLGNRPGTAEPLPDTLPPLPDLEPPPVGMPAALLDRRPDLLAARWRYSAATARIGAAMADLYPSLSLTGSAGNRASELQDLLSSDTLVYNLVANLAAPLYMGGRLRANVDAAEARAEEAASDYAGAVLDALREVEDALVRERAVRERLTDLETAAAEARAAARLSWERYQQGTGRLIEFLESERRRFAADQSLIAARSDLWNARVDLYLALGGDWIEEAEAAAGVPVETVSDVTDPAEAPAAIEVEEVR